MQIPGKVFHLQKGFSLGHKYDKTFQQQLFLLQRCDQSCISAEGFL